MTKRGTSTLQSISHRWRRLLVSGMLVLIAGVPISFAQTTVPILDQIRDRLRSRIEQSVSPGRIEVNGEVIFAAAALPQFYERRVYAPAWFDDSGPCPAVDSLLALIKAVDLEGLHPQDYHSQRIEKVLGSLRSPDNDWENTNPGLLTDLDLLATDAFLICGSHLVGGRVNPVSIDAEWFTKSRERNIPALLDSALQQGNVRAVLTDLLPNHKGYGRLRTRLAEYRQLAANGGWEPIAQGSTLHPGERSTRVVRLRERLAKTGDITPRASAEPELYDDSLAAGVVRFQRRHGLDADSAVGAKTLAALNVSAAERARQIAINLERWRWLPEDLGIRYILVNIANFELDAVEQDSVVLGMRVIVGRPYRRTPVFSDRMSYIVLNPYWNVPPNLAIQDIIPEIRKSPDYLATEQIKVFQGWGDAMRAIDPATVDWSKVSKTNLPYWFRQDPGPHNSLGRIKFMFPNPYNVYLHDTPKRELFARTERGFSSGCIRVQNPIGLAEYLLAADPKWTRATLEKALETAVDQTVALPEPIPVHILYWTAWVTPSGIMSFREDIYKRDTPLTQAMMEPPPSAN